MDINEIMVSVVIQWGTILTLGIICGIATRVMGASFWWGFLFGPIGLIVGAIVGASKRRERQTQAMMRMASYSGPARVRTMPREAPPETDVERFNRLYEGGEAPQKPRKKIYIRRS